MHQIEGSNSDLDNIQEILLHQIKGSSLDLDDIQETALARKSWIAYVGPITRTFFSELLGVSISWHLSPVLGIIVGVSLLAFLTYQVLYIRSYRLYYDRTGIWFYSGVFPWEQGVNGVDWRDTEGARFFTGFKSWIFKSYRITIKHRFTNSSTVVLSHMAQGKEAVHKINDLHQELSRANLLN